jgi:hypothetical protein
MHLYPSATILGMIATEKKVGKDVYNCYDTGYTLGFCASVMSIQQN